MLGTALGLSRGRQGFPLGVAEAAAGQETGLGGIVAAHTLGALIQKTGK